MREESIFKPVSVCPINTGLGLDFLQYLFPRDPETGNYKVSCKSILGEALTYLAYPVVPSVASLAPETPENGPERVSCTFELPRVRALDNARCCPLAYDMHAVNRINHILTICFELDFYRYYLKGLQYGYPKKEIVETYVISRNLSGEDYSYGALHKRAYRQDMRLIRAKSALLLRKARYFFDEQDKTLLEEKT